MADRPLDVVGIGNAIVDVLSHVDDALLAKLDLAKGTMALVDADEAAEIYDLSPPGIEVSGGSVANSMAGIASLGGACAYIGKVRDDELGAVFTHDMRAADVEFTTPKAKDGPPTARSLVFVTPDAQRTMNTYLGACTGLGPDDIDAATLRRAAITYLEGYLWDAPTAKTAMRQAMDTVHEAGRRVALSLSDPFCVDRYRAEFRALVEHEVDILFANEAEITSLYEVSHFDDAFQHVRGHCEMAALTRSEQGSVVISGEDIHVVEAAPIDRVVDTTGAGDLYAAGFLYGLTHGHDLAQCGRIGALAAAEVIGHFGARPETSLARLVARAA